MHIRRIEVQGVPVDTVTLDTAVALAQKWLEQNEQGNILAVNPEKVIKASTDAQVLELLQQASLLIPDGIGVVVAARWLGLGKFERVAGADLMPALCQMAERESYSVFLFGAAEEVNEKAAQELIRRFPELIIAGRQNGYVEDDAMPGLINAINQSGAQLVFVALGSPKQELWMRQHMPALNARVFQGVGGTFDVLAGAVKRAPKLFRNLHMEWLYRLGANPKRLLRQTALPRFMFNVLKQRVGQIFK